MGGVNKCNEIVLSFDLLLCERNKFISNVADDATYKIDMKENKTAVKAFNNA